MWEDTRTFHPEAVYCLGDLMGYGPNPNEVVQVVRMNNVRTLMDDYYKRVGFVLDDCRCVYHHSDDIARIARIANCDLLVFGHTHLPYTKQVGDTLVVNTGSVDNPKDGDPSQGLSC